MQVSCKKLSPKRDLGYARRSCCNNRANLCVCVYELTGPLHIVYAHVLLNAKSTRRSKKPIVISYVLNVLNMQHRVCRPVQPKQLDEAKHSKERQILSLG